jgi:Trk K+ transport system NAD-binding subunit
MQNLVYILIRRLRSPLIALIAVYAIFILGFVLIPGRDNFGPMSFFDAFYFVSFLGTTIGFGEIAGDHDGFGSAQRAWALVGIYATVVTWLYGIGSLLGVMQDPEFRRLLKQNRFERQVADIREPFYIICGYGDIGKRLVEALASEGIRSVVVDIDEDRINELELSDLGQHALGLTADAMRSEILEMAGIKGDWCKGVIALAADDNVNLTVAITVQLLNSKARLIARADTRESTNNILSFGANEVINPFEVFAERMALALKSPSLFILFEWMSGAPGEKLADPLFIRKGFWVSCGFGRFGKAMYDHLTDADIPLRIVEADSEKRDVPSGSVLGHPSEVTSLKRAGIEDAVGIIAGTDSDADNLSAIITARELNPDLFTVSRQMEQQNTPIFDAATINLVMQRGDIIGHKIYALIRTPLLGDFLRIATRFKEERANILISRVVGVVDNENPKLWEFVINDKQAPALTLMLQQRSVFVAEILRDPKNYKRSLDALPLFLKRLQGNVMLPENDRKLRIGDRVLMCGSVQSKALMQWSLRNNNVIYYILTGDTRPQGYVWKWFHKKTDEKRERKNDSK